MGWLLKHRTSIFAGTVPGLLLGLWAGYTESRGGIYVFAILFFPVLVGLSVVALLIVAAVVRRVGPVTGAAALGAAFVLGLAFGPDAPGSDQEATGEGSAGTRSQPAGLWSGPVTCHWRKDESTAVDYVAGFYVRITDPAFLRAKGLRDGHVLAVYLDGTLDSEVHLDGRLLYEEYPGTGVSVPVDLEGFATSAGRSGTADLGAIVITWTCSGGP
jgi:hypothetical protein